MPELPARPPYLRVVEELELLSRLAPYRPRLIGTPPLGIDLPGSDIDVACCAADLPGFAAAVRDWFGTLQGFCVEFVTGLPEPAVRVGFFAYGWEVELFCQVRHTDTQWGVRHFEVEQRLLALEPALRAAVLARKQAGMKTEPAFADVLQLSGDPYRAMLDLERLSDAALEKLLAARRP